MHAQLHDAAGPCATACAGGLNGYNVIARQLAALGVRSMYGVIGIPVTELASAAQVCGMRWRTHTHMYTGHHLAAWLPAVQKLARLPFKGFPGVILFSKIL